MKFINIIWDIRKPVKPGVYFYKNLKTKPIAVEIYKSDTRLRISYMGSDADQNLEETDDGFWCGPMVVSEILIIG